MCEWKSFQSEELFYRNFSDYFQYSPPQQMVNPKTCYTFFWLLIFESILIVKIHDDFFHHGLLGRFVFLAQRFWKKSTFFASKTWLFENIKKLIGQCEFSGYSSAFSFKKIYWSSSSDKANMLNTVNDSNESLVVLIFLVIQTHFFFRTTGLISAINVLQHTSSGIGFFQNHTFRFWYCHRIFKELIDQKNQKIPIKTHGSEFFKLVSRHK